MDDPFNDLWDAVWENTDDYGRRFKHQCADDERAWYLWNPWCLAILQFVETTEFDGWYVKCLTADRCSMSQTKFSDGRFYDAVSAAKFVFDFSDKAQSEATKQ